MSGCPEQMLPRSAEVDGGTREGLEEAMLSRFTLDALSHLFLQEAMSIACFAERGGRRCFDGRVETASCRATTSWLSQLRMRLCDG
eukprot:m.184493 g.184493  ORF g.184493 m.184493 type:complete len:86 (+) comp15391_c0_seq36:476-733(+)